MSHSSGRGQEPVAALVAVAAVCLGLSLYAGVLGGVLAPEPGAAGPDPREALDAVRDHLSTGGALDPARLASAPSVAPTDTRVNATLTTAGGSWTVGPRPAAGSPSASRRVTVAVDDGRARVGTLRVAVWR